MKRTGYALALVLLLIALIALLALAACTDETLGGAGVGTPEIGSATQPESEADIAGAAEGEPAPGSPDQGAAAAPSPTPPPTSNPSPDADGPADAPATPAGGATPLLSFEEAKAICSAWIGARADLTSYKVNWMSYDTETPPPTYKLFDEEFYEFNVAYSWNQTYSTGYSHVVLVHADTGEMLSLFMSQMDGEFLTQTVVPLDDWYNGESVTYPQALLTADDAIDIYDAWVEARTDDPALLGLYSLDRYFYSTYELLGEQYYHFSAEDDYLYWYNILVNANSGEMLFLMTSDGMFPETVIETLDEWVDKW